MVPEGVNTKAVPLQLVVFWLTSSTGVGLTVVVMVKALPGQKAGVPVLGVTVNEISTGNVDEFTRVGLNVGCAVPCVNADEVISAGNVERVHV